MCSSGCLHTPDVPGRQPRHVKNVVDTVDVAVELIVDATVELIVEFFVDDAVVTAVVLADDTAVVLLVVVAVVLSVVVCVDDEHCMKPTGHCMVSSSRPLHALIPG